KYVVRLEKHRETVRSLKNLYGILGLHRPRIAPGQAKSRVIEFRLFHQLRSQRCEREFSRPFLRTAVCARAASSGIASDIGDARTRPHAAEIRFAVREPRNVRGLRRLGDGRLVYQEQNEAC